MQTVCFRRLFRVMRCKLRVFLSTFWIADLGIRMRSSSGLRFRFLLGWRLFLKRVRGFWFFRSVIWGLLRGCSRLFPPRGGSVCGVWFWRLSVIRVSVVQAGLPLFRLLGVRPGDFSWFCVRCPTGPP